MPPTSAAHRNPQFREARIDASFQRPHHGGRNSGRMPVHPHHTTQRLKPERIAQAREKSRRAVRQDDVVRDRRSKLRHARSKPRWHAPPVQRQVCGSRSLHKSDYPSTSPNREIVEQTPARIFWPWYSLGATPANRIPSCGKHLIARPERGLHTRFCGDFGNLGHRRKRKTQ
jgi:hypothetical protein